ncbi:MAG: hypothetical protein NTY07_14910 [Bacteroidia bacterium]|nr:hypothetical protein [Bacteroidia bacterium]
MKNKILLSLIVIFAILIFDCNSAWSQSIKEYKKTLAFPKPIINGAVWENTTKEKIYNNCITALHLQGYELEPLMTSKESGLIITKPVNYYPPFWRHNLLGGEYCLNVLVYETDNKNLSINIQIKGTKIYDYKVGSKGESTRIEVQKGESKHYGGYKQSEVWNGLTVKMSEDIEQFLVKLESIQGKAISKTTITLNWE